MEERIFELVPIGEENAATARFIWRRIDLGTVATVKLKLNAMVARGLIERKRLPTWSTETSFYFKKPSAAQSSVAMLLAGLLYTSSANHGTMSLTLGHAVGWIVMLVQTPAIKGLPIAMINANLPNSICIRDVAELNC